MATFDRTIETIVSQSIVVFLSVFLHASTSKLVKTQNVPQTITDNLSMSGVLEIYKCNFTNYFRA